VFRRVTFACVLVAAGALVWLCPPARCEEDSNHREQSRLSAATVAGCRAVRKIVGKALASSIPRSEKTRSSSSQLAPRNARGKVEYSSTFIFSSRWTSARAITDVVRAAESRRNDQRSNRGVGGNDSGSVTDASLLGNSFLMRRLFDIFQWLGLFGGNEWIDLSTTITLPIARIPMAPRSQVRPW